MLQRLKAPSTLHYQGFLQLGSWWESHFEHFVRQLTGELEVRDRASMLQKEDVLDVSLESSTCTSFSSEMDISKRLSPWAYAASILV